MEGVYKKNKRSFPSKKANSSFSSSKRSASAKKFHRRANPSNAMQLGIEKKFYDLNYPLTQVVTAPNLSNGILYPGGVPGVGVACISAPERGSAYNMRDGAKIQIKSIVLKGSIFRGITNAETLPEAGSAVFIALVRDMQANNVAMNTQDCFSNPNSATEAPTVTPGAVSPLKNLLSGRRFKILKSDTFILNAYPVNSSTGSNFAQQGMCKTFDWFVPVDIPVQFNQQDGAGIASVVDNAIYVICFTSDGNSTNATVGNTACSVQYNSRIRFVG